MRALARGEMQIDSITVASAVIAARVEVRILAERSIRSATAYRKRFGQQFWKADDIIGRADRIQRLHAPPVELQSAREATWRMDNLRPGDTYYIVLIFGDENVWAEVPLQAVVSEPLEQERTARTASSKR